jgi:hypothetical protein
MKVKFPKRDKTWVSTDGNVQYHRYYNIHIEYILNILRYTNADIELVDFREFTIRSQTIFDCIIDKKLVRFDFSDFEKLEDKNILGCDVYFKFHYADSHEKYNNVFPFTPVNFHNWEEFNELTKSIIYKADGKVLNNQTPFGAAITRRSRVQTVLLNKYGNNLSFDRKTQTAFFNLINEGLVSVCVPGARNNMLDRGQCQYMGLGACTISPRLNTRLSSWERLIPGTHYIECKPDYSDLIEKIEWVRHNQNAAIQIGKAAKDIFQRTSTPDRQICWINECLNKVSL